MLLAIHCVRDPSVADQGRTLVTFRTTTPEVRALLDVIAAREGVSLSKLLASITEDYVRDYVERVGPDALEAEEVRREQQRRQRTSDAIKAITPDTIKALDGDAEP